MYVNLFENTLSGQKSLNQKIIRAYGKTKLVCFFRGEGGHPHTPTPNRAYGCIRSSRYKSAFKLVKVFHLLKLKIFPKFPEGV